MTIIKKVLLLIFVTVSFQLMNAQGLEDFTWKNRLIMVFTNSVNNPKYIDQIDQLRSEYEKFDNLKLSLFKILPKKYALGFNSEWRTSVLHQRKVTKGNFEIQLIGLDGTVKLSSSNVVPFVEIEKLINSMPMRQSELNSKN